MDGSTVYPNVSSESLSLPFDGGNARESLYSLASQGWPDIRIIRMVSSIEDSMYQEPKYVSYNCTIRPCVKTYSGAIRLSQLEEVVESEELIYTSSRDQDYTIADLGCIDPTGRQHLLDMGYRIQPQQRWVSWPVTIYRNFTTKEIEYTGSCEGQITENMERYCDMDAYRLAFYKPDHPALKDEYTRLFPLQCM